MPIISLLSQLPPYYLSNSSVLLITTQPLYKTKCIIHIYMLSGISLTWTCYNGGKNLKKCFLNINKQTTNALVRNIQQKTKQNRKKTTSIHISKIFDHRMHFPVSYHSSNMRKSQTVEDRAGAAWTFENKEVILKLIKSMLCCYSLKFTITYILSLVYCSQGLRKKWRRYTYTFSRNDTRIWCAWEVKQHCSICAR